MSFINLTINGTEYVDPSYLAGNTKIPVSELMMDWCTQIDTKIVLMVMFILTFWVLNNFIVKSLSEFLRREYPAFHNSIGEPVLDRFLSITETFALMSALILVFLANIQYGLTGFYWVWLGFLALSVLGGFYLKWKLH